MIQKSPHHVLVVGAGSIGERHVRCFLATGRTAVSFVETQSSRCSEVASRYPQAKAYEDIDVALAHHPTAAVIATPAPLHVPLAARLSQLGLHVLIEKPLSISMDGIDALQQTAKEKDVVVSVAYVYRAHPALIEMKQAIASGRFGSPVELVAVCGQHFPFYQPRYFQTYYTRHETGGGAVQDALTHVINAGEWLIGPVDRVVADTAHQVLDKTPEVEDTVHVLARHGDVPASYSLNQHQAPNETTITVICRRGTVRFEMYENRWRSIETPGGPWTDHAHKALERDQLFTHQANYFLDAVERNGRPACTLEEAIQTLAVNLAILASSQQSRWMRITGQNIVVDGGRTAW